MLPSEAFGRTAIAAMMLRLASRGLAFASAIMLAHVLGVVEYGKYAYAISWATILGVLAVAGFDRLLIRDVARYRTTSEWSLMKGLLRRAGVVVLVTSFVVAVVAAGVGSQVVSTSLRLPFLIGCLLVPLVSLTVIRESTLQGLGRIEFGLLPEYVVLPLTLMLFVGAAKVTDAFSLGATSTLILNVGAALLTLCIGSLILRRCLPTEFNGVAGRLEASRWAGGAVPLALIGIITVASSQIGAVLLGSFAHAQDVGIYQVCTRLALVLSLALVAVILPFAPRAAELHALGQKAELQRVTTRAVRASVAFSIPVALLLIGLRHPLLSVFGKGFDAGSSALVLLVLAQLFNAFVGPVGILLMMTHQERRALVGITVAFILEITVSASLIPQLGIEGAAIGNLVGVVSWNAVFAVLAYTRLRINPLPFSIRPARRMV